MLDERKLNEEREYLLSYRDGLWFAYQLPRADPPFSDSVLADRIELSDVCDCSLRQSSNGFGGECDV